MSIIDVQGLDVRFDNFHAVKGASFAVEEGESFGIVGESGCGKTTVLRCLSGLISNWTGTISVAGKIQGRKRGVAFGIGKDGGERVLRTIGGPSCVAKNRFSLPEQLPLSWPAFMAAFTNPSQTNVEN